jgi:hypothetical protein
MMVMVVVVVMMLGQVSTFHSYFEVLMSGIERALNKY